MNDNFWQRLMRGLGRLLRSRLARLVALSAIVLLLIYAFSASHNRAMPAPPPQQHSQQGTGSGGTSAPTVTNGGQMSYSAFLAAIDNNLVDAAEFTRDDLGNISVIANLKNGTQVTVSIVPAGQQDVYNRLIAHKVDVYNKPLPHPSMLLSLIINLLPILLMVGLFWFLMKRMGGGGGAGGSSGRSLGLNGQQDISVTQSVKVTFDDVGGVGHIRPQLEAVVSRLTNQITGQKGKQLGRLGAKVPRGFLFVGPPGTGKTLLAKAIAGEVTRQTNVPVGFIVASGSQFVEMFVGVGAQRVRQIFARARATGGPCIIFIDEIDAVGKKRGNTTGNGGNDEREQTLNQILVEMDGFGASEKLLVIAATNRAELLDEALLRPGRFDRKVMIPLPDMDGREEIFNIHAKALLKRANQTRMTRMDYNKFREQGGIQQLEQNSIFAKDVNWETAARETPHTSGAEIEEILNRAAEKAELSGKDCIEMNDIRSAFQSLHMGDEMPRNVAFIDSFCTAVHEILGHGAVAGWLLRKLGSDDADTVQTVTIVPRGQSLGAVWSAPTKDRVSASRLYYEGRLSMASGGQLAEILFLGPDKVSSGASSDIEQTTRMASGMVAQFAMSGANGLTFRNYVESNGFTTTKAKQDIVDEAIDEVIARNYLRAEAIILSFAEDRLEELTRTMLVMKTLGGEEFLGLLLDGKSLRTPAELSLGDNETQFKQLWQDGLAYRNQRRAEIRKDHPELAAQVGL